MSAIVEFAGSELGLTLYPAQARALAEFEDGHEQAVWRVGRRGGKSLLADVVALYDATVRDHLRARMLPGEPRIAAIICPRLDQAQAHIARIARLAERSPRLRRLLAGPPTSDTVALRNGSEITAYPCSARSIRGGAWSSCILDELAHFVTTADGNAAGDRILEAAQPSLAQFGRDGWLIAISTPRWRQGAFHKLSKRAESGRFPYVHAVVASTAEWNPMIEADWLEDRRREDPDTFGREYLAQWVDGASSYLANADVVAAVRHGVGTLLPEPGFSYAAALDPAYSLDAFAMAIAHRELDDAGATWYVVDGVWSWHRAGHARVLDEVAQIARAYGVHRLRTDQHAAVPILEGLAQRGLEGDYRAWTSESKGTAYSRLKLALGARQVELPDHEGLVAELCGLEAVPTAGGRTRIAAAGTGHDDLAVVAAAVVDDLATPAEKVAAAGSPVVATSYQRWDGRGLAGSQRRLI